MFRPLTLLVLLAALGYQLDREQREGRFQQADDLFLDFLLANARDRFVPEAGKTSDQVVLVRMREEDKQEYGAWPPPPIDWQIVLKGLVPFDPEVVVIATPLTWGQPPPEFVAEVGQALQPFPSVVLGVEAEVNKDTPPPLPTRFLKEAFPNISGIDGDPNLLWHMWGIKASPEESIRRQMELGLTIPSFEVIKGKVTLPLAVRCADAIAPSLTLQVLARYSRAPYSQQRLRVGSGAGAHLGKGIYLPLDNHGGIIVSTDSPLPSVNALNFMTGDLADGLSADDKAKLGKGKIIVIGIDNDTPRPTSARLQAAALAHTLSLPRVHAISLIARWIICGIAAVCGCFLLRHRGGKALRTGLLLIFAALVASFLTFQSSLTWFPPAVPAAMLAASTLFAMLFGRKHVGVPASPPVRQRFEIVEPHSDDTA